MNIERDPVHWDDFKPYRWDGQLSMEFPNHAWLKYKSRNLHWIDYDNKQRWLESMEDPELREYLEKRGYIDPTVIDYKFNQYGFRCDEFTDDPSIMCFGCSFTGGVGLSNEHVWPTILSKKLGLQCWNLGIGGGSMDMCFRLMNYFIDKLNVKYVFLLRPFYGRFDFYSHDGVCTSIQPQFNEHPVKKHWYLSDQNAVQNYLKNFMAMSYLCERHKIPLYSEYCEHLQTLHPRVEVGKPRGARDIVHYGVEHHIQLADKFFEMVEKK